MLKNLFFKNKKQQGLSLLEVLIAMFILSTVFLLNFQALLLLKLENIEQEIETGAVALSKELLDDLRVQKNLQPGTINQTNLTSFGYSYDTTIYICTQTPTINTQNIVTSCSNTINPANPIRYIVLLVKRNNETIYTVQTIFTELS